MTAVICPAMAQATAPVLNFVVNLSEAATVDTTGGTPTIALDIGGVTTGKIASYASGSGTAALTFSYTAVPGDVDMDGIGFVSNALVLNGGTITDTNGNPLTDLTFTAPNMTGVKVDYPSLGMDFIADADGRCSINGTVYDTPAAFLTAAAGSFTRSSSATASRNAAVFNLPTGGWHTAGMGSVYVQPRHGTDITEASTFVLENSGSVTANNIYIARTGLTQSEAVIRESFNLGHYNQPNTIGNNTVNRQIITYQTNDMRCAGNGSLRPQDTSGAIPVVNRLRIGAAGNSGATTYLNGHMQVLKYYPVRISDSNLTGLTTP